MASAEQVQMQMMYCLSALIACVNDNAVSLVELVRARKVSGRRHHVTEQGLMLG